MQILNEIWRGPTRTHVLGTYWRDEKKSSPATHLLHNYVFGQGGKLYISEPGVFIF